VWGSEFTLKPLKNSIFSARGLVVEELVDDVEMRVVVAKVLAAAANAVFVAQHLLKLGAHLTTALARLQVHNITRKSGLEAGSAREKKGAEEWKNVRNSVWQFGTGTSICRWRARVFPERESLVFFLRPLKL
jgi:hypothetical protein